MAGPLIGVINAGSSSLKFSFYDDEQRILSGQIDGIGVQPRATAIGPDGEPVPPPDITACPPTTPADVLGVLLPWGREQLHGRKLDVLGHRVAHGGMTYSRPLHITPGVVADLEKLVTLAPLHQPYNLAAIKTALELNPALPQVACFDTAFHRSIPEVAQAFALPFELHAQGVRRYGFHGLSYEYIAAAMKTQAPEIADGRVVAAHLGNGASLCALRGGVSIATTMGFSALDGLPMGTRCGALDPGVVLHLIREKGMSVEEVEDLLYRRSGLLGLSGLSSDFRDLLSSDDVRAWFSVTVYCYRVSRHIGSLVAALGGIDGLVFTAGVGENAAPVRAEICRACAWLGLHLDEEANSHHGPRISAAQSAVQAYVIPTDENLMIARHARALVVG
jgi:acetate kinase